MKTKFISAIGAACILASCNSATQVEEPEGIHSESLKGGATVTWIRDTPASRPSSTKLFPKATPELIESLGLNDGVPSSMGAFVLRKGDEVALFDAGMGSPDSKLIDGLTFLGLAPEDVDYVFLTHLHGDHIGGMMKDGAAVFCNAEVYLSQPEYDGWLEMEGRNAQALSLYSIYADQIKTFQFGDKLPMGIEAIDAPGHTPGHTAYKRNELIVVGDIMHAVALQMADFSISATYDGDPELSAKTREEIVNMAKEQKLLMAGMHFPEPAFIDYRK